MSSSEVKEGECSICLDTFKDPVSLPCNHKFCSKCFGEWRYKYDSTQSHRTCPVCRANIPPTRGMVIDMEGVKQMEGCLIKALNSPGPMDIPSLLPGGNSDITIDRKHVIRIHSLPPHEQQDALRAVYEERLRTMQCLIREFYERHGDCSKILNEVIDNEGVILPTDIADKALSSNVEPVIKWLGPEPISEERINAKVNEHGIYNFLLQSAVNNCDKEFTHWLLQMGADINLIDRKGWPCMHHVVLFKNSGPIASVLLEWGADIEPFHRCDGVADLAETNGYLELAELLRTPLGGRRCEIFGLASQADMNGMTGIATKYMSEKDRYVVLLEETDKKVLVRPTNLKRRDRTPNDCSYTSRYNSATKCFEFAPLHRKCDEYQILQDAIQTSQSHEEGHSVSEELKTLQPLPEDFEQTPGIIHKALVEGYISTVISWLGPNPIPKERLNGRYGNYVWTLLHSAGMCKNKDIMYFLLQNGADVNPLDDEGRTPLNNVIDPSSYKNVKYTSAIRFGCGKLLLEWGARTDLPGFTAGFKKYADVGHNQKLSDLIRTPLGGRRCEILGLESRPDLNGKTVIVGKHFPVKDRYAVVVEETNEKVQIQAANLKRRDRTPTDCTFLMRYDTDTGRFLRKKQRNDAV